MRNNNLFQDFFSLFYFFLFVFLTKPNSLQTKQAIKLQLEKGEIERKLFNL